MFQSEYARKIVDKYGREAPHPACRRLTPAHKRAPAGADAGVSKGSCRSYVGSLMYLSRATRPDITLATNWLARSVTSWTAAQDKGLEQLLGYVSATQDLCLKSYVDVRGKKGERWLDL